MTELSSPVCILGMHRSGTSLLAKILNLLGVYLGSETNLLAPSSSNPKGYWEHQQIIKINDEILNRLGGNWYALPAFADGWERSSELDDLRQSARETLFEEFAGIDVWGWKDPRTCLTLAFWQRIVGPMKYVICFRNPIDVASSLKRRDGFSIEQGVFLWLVYLQRVLARTANDARLFVFYEDLLDNEAHEIERIAPFIERQEQARRPEVRQAVRDSISKKLQHHHTQIDYESLIANWDDSKGGIETAQLIYAQLKRGALHESDRLLDRAIKALEPEVNRQKRDPNYAWVYDMRLTINELATLIPDQEGFVLIDWYQWGANQISAGRKAKPLLTDDAKYAMRPLNDDEAIRELERRREDGLNFVVFGRPAFWWFDSYPRFYSYLKTKFVCALENSRIVVFKLEPSEAVR